MQYSWVNQTTSVADVGHEISKVERDTPAVDCLDKGLGPNTSFRNSRCPQISPRLQLAATGRQWTSVDLEKPILVAIPSDFSRSSHRSGRCWTSLNAIGWWGRVGIERTTN
jgi:hypothetical protein